MVFFRRNESRGLLYRNPILRYFADPYPTVSAACW